MNNSSSARRHKRIYIYISCGITVNNKLNHFQEKGRNTFTRIAEKIKPFHTDFKIGHEIRSCDI